MYLKVKATYAPCEYPLFYPDATGCVTLALSVTGPQDTGAAFPVKTGARIASRPAAGAHQYKGPCK